MRNRHYFKAVNAKKDAICVRGEKGPRGQQCFAQLSAPVKQLSNTYAGCHSLLLLSPC